MSIVLNSLPYEIIELISHYVSKKDLLNTILVSHSWYKNFHTSLYKSISINSLDNQEKILSSFRKQDLPGYLVRHLTLQKVQLSEEDIFDTIKLFPQVDTLEVDWCVWPSSINFQDAFDPEAPFTTIHPPQGLPTTIDDFFTFIGPKLRSLTINALQYELTDIWSILALCPKLKHLNLLNLSHEHIITLGYLETIHELCPHLISLKIKCTHVDPNPALLPQYQQNVIVINLTSLQRFSLTSRLGSSKWALWLPYFAMKYPQLEHIQFKHSGLGRDGGANLTIPDSVFDIFNDYCRQLKSIQWNKIVVQHDQQEGLFNNMHANLERIEAYEDFMIPNSLIHSPIVQPGSLMSNLLTSLTIGQPPVSVTTTQVLSAIGQCPKLTHLKIQECFGDPELAYNMDDILYYCQGITQLTIKDVHLSYNQQPIRQHPLKTLIMKRSSFTEGVFPIISRSCLDLNHVELLGCVQTNCRDQIKIDLPLQNLTTLKIQGLRTRRYYVGCRIRFFAINQSHWYYMTKFDVRSHPIGHKRAYKKYRNMEYAQSFDRLDDRDIQELRSLVTTETLKAWDIELVKQHLTKPFTTAIDPSCWDPENIYYSGLVQITCKSIQNLSINDKLVVL